MYQVDGVEVTLTYYIYDDEDNELVKIYYYGKTVRLETIFGLLIEYDGYFTQCVAVPDEAAGNIQGLCGNYNSDITDEKILPDSTDLTDDPESDSKIADFFQINDANGT